ncbi:MAG TPA: CARDB domain-containing protein [Nocardioides sp.]|nr:CARDB domain-containing protein [Nocardioides sp.]
MLLLPSTVCHLEHAMRTHRPRRGRRLAVALVALSCLVPLAVSGPAAAARRPDLKVTALSVAPGSVAPGGQLAVTATTANPTSTKAGRSVTRIHLSSDRRWSRSDRVLGKIGVKALRSGSQRRTTTVSVPEATKPGAWYVVACADATAKVRESREGNNCLVTRRPTTVETPTDGPTFPQQPNPLTVDSTLQTDRAVSKQVYPHETTVMTATAEDGTTYTLTLPPNALLGPATITMTPVASVQGLPMSGGLVAGVQLEPHGLALYEPVELVIDSPDAGPLAAQTPFLFHEGGEDFHLYAPDLPEPGDDANTLRMTLTHFSTPGLGSATPGDRGGLADHPPARTQAQVEAAISSLIAQERASQLAGNAPDAGLGAKIVGILESYYQQALRPRLVEAENSTELDEAEAALLISEALSLARQLALWGQEDSAVVADIMQRVERVLRAVMNSAWKDCLDHDLSALHTLFRTARMSALFGYAWEQEAMDKLQGCGRFEVRFDQTRASRGSYSGSLQSGSHDSLFRMQSTIQTRLFDINSTAPLTHASFSYFSDNTIHDSDPDCYSTTRGTTTTPGTMRAVATPIVDANVLEKQAGATRPQPDVLVSVGVLGNQQPTQTYVNTGCAGTSYTWQDSRWSLQAWLEGLPAQLTPTLGEELVGVHEKHRTETTQGDTTTVDTIVEVWHKPQL